MRATLHEHTYPVKTLHYAMLSFAAGLRHLSDSRNPYEIKAGLVRYAQKIRENLEKWLGEDSERGEAFMQDIYRLINEAGMRAGPGLIRQAETLVAKHFGEAR